MQSNSEDGTQTDQLAGNPLNMSASPTSNVVGNESWGISGLRQSNLPMYPDWLLALKDGLHKDLEWNESRDESGLGSHGGSGAAGGSGGNRHKAYSGAEIDFALLSKETEDQFQSKIAGGKKSSGDFAFARLRKEKSEEDSKAPTSKTDDVNLKSVTESLSDRSALTEDRIKAISSQFSKGDEVRAKSKVSSRPMQVNVYNRLVGKKAMSGVNGSGPGLRRHSTVSKAAQSNASRSTDPAASLTLFGSIKDRMFSFFTGESDEERHLRLMVHNYKTQLTEELALFEKAANTQANHGRSLLLDFDVLHNQLMIWAQWKLIPTFQMQAWARVARASLLHEMSIYSHRLIDRRLSRAQQMWTTFMQRKTSKAPRSSQTNASNSVSKRPSQSTISTTSSASREQSVLDKSIAMTTDQQQAANFTPLNIPVSDHSLTSFCNVPSEVLVNKDANLLAMAIKLMKLDKHCSHSLTAFRTLLPESESLSTSQRHQWLSSLVTQYSQLMALSEPAALNDQMPWEEIVAWYSHRQEQLRSLEESFSCFVEDEREREGRLFRKWCSLLSMDTSLSDSSPGSDEFPSDYIYRDACNKSRMVPPARSIHAFIRYFTMNMLGSRYPMNPQLMAYLLQLVEAAVYRRIHLQVYRYHSETLLARDIKWRNQCRLAKLVDPETYGVPSGYYRQNPEGIVCELSLNFRRPTPTSPMGTESDSEKIASQQGAEASNMEGSSKSFMNLSENDSNENTGNNITVNANTQNSATEEDSGESKTRNSSHEIVDDDAIASRDQKSTVASPSAKEDDLKSISPMSDALRSNASRSPMGEPLRNTLFSLNLSEVNRNLAMPDLSFAGRVKAGIDPLLRSPFGAGYAKSSKLLGLMGTAMTPKEIIFHLLVAIKLLFRDAVTISGKNDILGADTMFPLLVLVLIHSEVCSIHLILQYLSEHALLDCQGESSYYITCLEAAVAYIMNMKFFQEDSTLSSSDVKCLAEHFIFDKYSPFNYFQLRQETERMYQQSRRDELLNDYPYVDFNNFKLVVPSELENGPRDGNASDCSALPKESTTSPTQSPQKGNIASSTAPFRIIDISKFMNDYYMRANCRLESDDIAGLKFMNGGIVVTNVKVSKSGDSLQSAEIIQEASEERAVRVSVAPNNASGNSSLSGLSGVNNSVTVSVSGRSKSKAAIATTAEEPEPNDETREEQSMAKLGEWIRDQNTMEETICILQQEGWMV